MATSIHIGKHRVQTVSASDGSTIAPGTVTAVAPDGGVGVAVDPATNNVTVSGQQAGNFRVVYGAPGFADVTETFAVAAPPILVITDGPEQ